MDIASKTKNYEAVLTGWYAELQYILNDTVRTASLCEYGSIQVTDEINYWDEKLKDVEFIMVLMMHRKVRRMMKYLTEIMSPFVILYENIVVDLSEAIYEAKSNVHWLQTLREPCKTLNEIHSLDEIMYILPSFFSKFIMIYDESLYYNKQESFDTLCDYLGNQVTYLCRKTINPSTILTGDVDIILKLIHKCLRCCNNFIAVYTEVVSVYNTLVPIKRQLMAKFKSIYPFITRLKDLKYILKAKIIFKRLDVHHLQIPKPKFSFFPGLQFEQRVLTNESIFDQIMKNLEKPINAIFNVDNDEWTYRMKIFQYALNNVCLRTERLSERALSKASNDIDYMNILQSLLYFSNWPPIEVYFRKKTEALYENIISDIKFAINSYYKKKQWICYYMSKYSGISILAIVEFNRITLLKNLVTSRPWLLTSPVTNDLRKQYDAYEKLHYQMIPECFRNWWKQLDPDIDKKLKNTIFIEDATFKMYRVFAVNLNDHVYESISEIRFWRLLKMDMPFGHSKFTDIAPDMLNTYKNVTKVVKNFKFLVAGLSNLEILLFSQTLHTCRQTLKPLETKLTWSELQKVDKYLIRCYYALELAQEIEDCYKQCNTEIVGICCKIANTPLFHEKPKPEIRDFKQISDVSDETTIISIIRCYNEIIKYLTIVYEKFEKYIKHILSYWENYIEKIDFLVHEALIFNARWSMENILTLQKESIFVINISLERNKIVYNPSLVQLVVYSTNSVLNIASTLRFMPRLSQTFKLKTNNLPYTYSIVTDRVCCDRLQATINKSTKELLTLIKNYIKNVLEYSNIWTVDKQMYIQIFMSKPPAPGDFDVEITMYNNYFSVITGMRTETIASRVIIQIENIKMQILKNCREWIYKFSQLLLHESGGLINEFYEYIELNGTLVMILPLNLAGMIKYTEFRNRLELECDEKKEDINLIISYFAVLDKHKIMIPKLMNDMFKNMLDSWNEYLKKLNRADLMMQDKQDEFHEIVLNDLDNFKRECKEFEIYWEEYKKNASKNEGLSSADALNALNIMEEKYNQMLAKEMKLKADLAIFNESYSRPSGFNVKKEMEFLYEVFQLIQEWDISWNHYKTGNFWEIKVSEMEITVQRIYKKLVSALRKIKDENWKMMKNTLDKIEDFKRVLPLINSLKNPAMRSRHWDEVRELIMKHFDETDPEFTLEQIMLLQMQKYGDQISEISNKATMELNIENTIKTIADVWNNTNLTVEPTYDEGLYNIKASDEISQTLEDHLLLLHSMMGSKYISISIKDADYWEKGLTLVMEVLDMVLAVQRQYTYSEKIFRGEDIQKEIPNEAAAYAALTEEWKDITSGMNTNKNVFNACNSKPLLKKLIELNERLGEIQRALEVYMDTKRHIFPRFYFISNDDLLDILVNANEPELLQPHFKKCFDNINKLKFEKVNEDNSSPSVMAIGMYSADGEYVKWVYAVHCTGAVENWLQNIEYVMRYTLQTEFRQVMESLITNLKSRDKWVLKWPGQLCITSSQIQWTANCTHALFQAKAIDSRKPLKKIRKIMKNVLSSFTDAIRGELKKVDRLKIVALVTIEIHARDVIDKMYKINCMDVTDFQWMSQLRFYKKKDEIIIRQTNTEQIYGYEYLGNSGRLAITPLTERCYITLTTALNLFRGSSPKGPAGTGKTETVKDLGKNLAYYVIVINCSDGLDYKSMGHMFSGLAQQGAWGCFDEFNRINIEVLSVVAQQIQSIFAALAAHHKSFMFEKNIIKLIPTCGIFITMNPGYAGRTELPDNLKSMFRAISMMVPDSKLIAEITLSGEGFKDTKSLANKVYVLFLLCKQQLSKQGHYEFGLRGLVTLLRYAGKYRRQNLTMADDEVLLLAMHNMNLAKLTVEDLPLFMGITNDLFPNVTLPVVKNDILINAITKCMIDNNLQPSQSAIAKIIQLYETKISRHSVMILGFTGSTKTTTWKTLIRVMALLKKEKVDSFETVIEYPMNPKALTLGELYGEYNKSTQEWMDGVLSSTMRKSCSDSSSDQKWIIFDGPVDAIWIENMNSVMDDNKVLTLVNNERITMPEQVSLLFEVEDLAVASPATVSRCGIVFNDYKDFGWVLFVNSWLKKCIFKPYKDNIEINFSKYINNMLEFKRLNCVETIPLPELSSIQSLCKLLECFTFKDLAKRIPAGIEEEEYANLIRIWFLFCMVWSVCAVVSDDGRKKINNFLRESEKSFPLTDTVYHYYVDTNYRQFRHWNNLLQNTQWTYDAELPFFKIIVPTIDTVRYNYLVEGFLRVKQPILLVGPVGTGKSSTIQKVLDAMNKQKYLFLTINMSGHTTANNVQETIEGRLEKRGKDLYVPQGNKTLVTFLDDMNMPEREEYGAQPPLELIRQWIDYEFWFDRYNQSLKYVKSMLLVGAMGPPGGGRNVISNRLTSCFSVINMEFPEEPQIMEIYSSMLHNHLSQFDEQIRNLLNKLTDMTISLYKSVVTNMLPTPTKMHYLFNLRDISKIFQGLLRSNTDYQKTKEDMLRLWCNEAFHVFNDKLIDKNDQNWFLEQINQQLGKHFDRTHRSLCTSDRYPLFCDFLNEHLHYQEVIDENYLREFIIKCMDEYNSKIDVVPIDLVLFRDAIDHICRITRVISQPRGYILLIGTGGSGKTSLAKISNWICEYSMFMIELTKIYNTADFKEDLKKLYYRAGVKDQPTTFLFKDTQIVNESFLEIINNILSTGEVSRLYRDDEFEEIKEMLSDSAKLSGIPETTEAIYTFFLDRVRNNLHIILCLSPIGNKYRMWLRQYPSIVNCTTIDWYLDWPQEALLEVAFKSLSSLEILATITGEARMYDVDAVALTESELKFCIANLFAIIHHSVVEYSNVMLLELKRYNYVTPTNYLELVNIYKEILYLKRDEIANSANKLRKGLSKINETSEKVAGMTVELEKATTMVFKYTEECDQFLQVILEQTAIADKKKNEVDEKSIKIKDEEVVCQDLYNIAVADLEKAMPALLEAMEALNALNKNDLAEVKSFSKPPDRVKLVLEAVMILKQAEPSWIEAKKQLGDPNFLTQLKEFDKDHIPPKVLKKIATYTRNPEFEPEKVGIQSIAAKSLAKWVIAIEKYAIIYKIVAPKKESADSALSSLKEKQLALSIAQEQLTELQDVLLKLKINFDSKMEEKEELVRRAEKLKFDLERAASLIEGLADEKKRWTLTVKQLDIDFDYLPGDCLLSIAFVSYMGPFITKYREILFKFWTTSVRDMQIPSNSDFEIKSFLSDPAIIRSWNIYGLPQDDFSTENGIIISRSTRWPLVIDPQCQALKWIKNMEADNGLKIVDFYMLNYMKILEIALEEGYPALLQINSEHLDPAITPILLKSTIKKGNQHYIKMGDKLLPFNQNFRFFITTKLRNPYYSPQIFTRLTVINFAIKVEGLEDQLLDVLIGFEKPDLKQLKDTLVINISKGKQTLIQLDDELLRLLNEIEGSLLENEELFKTLASSNITSSTVKEQLESAMSTQAEIEYAREGYRVCAKRAAILFVILNDLNQIDPMYQFSLDAYMALFENSIKKSEKSIDLSYRLFNLNSYHTYAAYQNTCRGLFEIHKLLFSFQICISILMANSLISKIEFEFLLKGGIVLNKDRQTENPCSGWLSPSCWDNITELDKIPGFLGIEKSFAQYSREWKDWYTSPNPENLNLVGKWNENSSILKKPIFVRCLRLDRLSFAMANFVSEKLGRQFIEPPMMDLLSALGDSSNKSPLIFLLSPGVDPTNMIISLSKLIEKDRHFETVSLGQGQAPIATQLIEDGQKIGKWVYLANCHLSLSWMPQLDKIVDIMQDGKTHPDFRLWLSSDPNPNFPIAILQSSIKMTTEPPKGLKANMKRLYHNITEIQFSKCTSQDKYKKLLFSLCFFHSVLIERKKFQNLGWNVVYSFNDSDFEVSENLLSIYLNEYENVPWNALKYLIAGICYGGHVTDDWDRLLLNTYINQYFNENTITIPYYRLSPLQNYYVPRDGHLKTYTDYIESLPIVDSPEVFGQNSNAEMTSLMGLNRVICETLLVFQGQSSVVAEENVEDKVLVLSTTILEKMPGQIDYNHTVKILGSKRSPLDVVLLQEILRYNSLLEEIIMSLIGLKKGIKGLVVMSPDLEEVFNCIFENRVPSQWLNAYSSLMPLGSWTLDFIERINHFTVWATRISPPVIFWLGAYTYPTSFLTAVLQIHSRSSSTPIDLLKWEFIPIYIPHADIVMPAQEGVYIRHLYLEGANWDSKNSCLSESIPLKFICDLPIIQFKPIKTVIRQKDVYQCPVYYYPQRCGKPGKDAYIVTMNLNSGTQKPEHWIKRATAVVLSLST